METTWIIEAGVGLAVIGLFAGAWLRFSRPMRVVNGGNRVAPQISSSSTCTAVAAGDAPSRRSPSL
ncbi:MAG: hypothetical protein ACT4QA_11495 [Panacagrimonas sp.]